MELVEEGKLTPYQIAIEVGTTVKNVWKETSYFRKKGRITINETRILD